MAALDAGWPVTVPGVTLNRFCGSGQQAVNFAAMGVMAGLQELVVAGGVESMSRPAPLQRRRLHGQQRTTCRPVPAGAAGHLGRPDRHASKASRARSATRSPSTSQERAAEAHRRGPLRPQRSCRSTTTMARSRSTTTSSRARARRMESLAGLNPSFAKMGVMSPDGRHPHARRDLPALRLPADRAGQPRPPRRQLVRRRRRRRRGARWPRPSTRRRTASSRARRIVMTATAGAEPVIMLTAPGPGRASWSWRRRA